jgi:hypothetical protein
MNKVKEWQEEKQTLVSGNQKFAEARELAMQNLAKANQAFKEADHLHQLCLDQQIQLEQRITYGQQQLQSLI